jgi:hypothetical protein
MPKKEVEIYTGEEEEPLLFQGKLERVCGERRNIRELLKKDRNDRQVWENATSKVNPIIEMFLILSEFQRAV